MGADQLALPLAFAPETVRTHGLRAAHPRPLVSLGKPPGRPFSSFRTTPAKAWRYPELEYGNAGSPIAALVLDCDDPHKMGLGLPDLPPPNWIVRRPANNHAHLTWTPAEPVHRYPDARIDPLRYLAWIAEYYAHVVGADPGYAGVLAHNPASIYRSPYKTAWGRETPYALDQLASIIPFDWDAADSPPDGRRSERRSIRGRGAMGRQAGQRSPAGAPRVDDCQSGLRAPTAVIRGAGDGAFYREIPDGPREAGIVRAGSRGRRREGARVAVRASTNWAAGRGRLRV